MELEKYAQLTVKNGVNLTKGQELVISSPVECIAFTRLLAKAGYEAGAKEVIVHFSDEKLARLKYDNAPMEVFENVPEWVAGSRNYYAARGAAFISIAASDPDIFSGVDIKKLAANNKSSFVAFKPFYDSMDKNELQWSIVSVPTLAWAKKVFPNKSDDDAIQALWDAILKAVRVDDNSDPVLKWLEHDKQLKTRAEFLNKTQFKEFKLKNELGTDLTIGMPENHIWEGGSCTSASGVDYFPNMPTEEVFTMPHREKVNGKVVSSMPLNYRGNLIDKFALIFKDGRIVDFTAETGYDTLKMLIDTDDGSHYLGELALVPYKSPISDMKIMFYNTLFDENASCHLAIGNAYPTTIQGGAEMTKEELMSKGGNDSMEHVDFMFGTADLSIIGVTADGKETVIFKDGNFAI